MKFQIKKNIKIENNIKLIDEVVDLTDQPNVITCEFDRKFLKHSKRNFNDYYAAPSKIFSDF